MGFALRRPDYLTILLTIRNICRPIDFMVSNIYIDLYHNMTIWHRCWQILKKKNVNMQTPICADIYIRHNFVFENTKLLCVYALIVCQFHFISNKLRQNYVENRHILSCNNPLVYLNWHVIRHCHCRWWFIMNTAFVIWLNCYSSYFERNIIVRLSIKTFDIVNAYLFPKIN